MKTFFFILLFFQALTLIGQPIDVETEKYPGVKKIKVQAFRGIYAKKTSRSVYYFDKKGNAVKSSHFYKIKRLADYMYLYNDKGFLLEKNNTYDVNNKRETSTTRFTYEFDTNDRLIRKTTDFGNGKLDVYYQDFDNNNPQTIIYPAKIEKREYNSLSRIILKKIIENDAIKHIEKIQYNDFGDKIYSNLPLYDKKKLETIIIPRYSAVEVYEYIYDKSNRWIEKYVVYDNKKVLLEKRAYYK